LKFEISFVASRICEGTITTILVSFVVGVDVSPRGTLHSSMVKQACLTLVAKERAGNFSDPINMTLLYLICLAGSEIASPSYSRHGRDWLAGVA